MQQWVKVSARAASCALTLLGLASVGCSGPPQGATLTGNSSSGGTEAPPFDPFAIGASVVCDATGIEEEEEEPEIYVVSAMNAKLEYYPDFAAEAGFDSVSDCDGARAFMAALVAYRAKHPEFDADQPLTLDTRPDPEVPAAPSDSRETSKILNGTPIVNTPVVQLIFRSHDGGHSSFASLSRQPARCSGTFIAKNWILTAAHCLQRASIEACLINGTPKSQCRPDFLTYSDKWKIRFPIATPTGQLTWFELEKMGAVGYANASWPGMTPQHHRHICTTTNCDDPEPGGPTDIALLYLPDDTRLPPQVELDGAKRFSIVLPQIAPLAPPQARWSLDFYGWGRPEGGGQDGEEDFEGESVLRKSVVSPGYRLDGGMILATKETAIDSIPCKGDSGGPLVRRVTLPTNLGNQEVEVIVGINSWGGGPNNTDKTCTPPGVVGDFSRFVPLHTHISFIEETIRRWPGFRTYECRKRPEAGTAAPDVAAECWGTPCDNYGLLSPQNPLGCAANEFCSRPGREFVSRGITRCDTCGTANNCDCIVGQCITKP